jgi:hypothetical protein
VDAEEAAPTARMLAASGFKRARVEFGWNSMSYDDPARLSNPERLRTYVGALKQHGIRPLVLLNAHHGIPGPSRFFDAMLLQEAKAGDRRVRLGDATARAVVPHKTGLNSRDSGRAADVIFTSVGEDGWATLSRPLPRDLPAGSHSAVTLRYAPFGPPQLPDGQPNPRFEETLAGWLDYVGAVARETRAVMGSDGFDVEIWNELSFGSDFLYERNYYEPSREQGQGDVVRAIRERTVDYLRDPATACRASGSGTASQTSDHGTRGRRVRRGSPPSTSIRTTASGAFPPTAW